MKCIGTQRIHKVTRLVASCGDHLYSFKLYFSEREMEIGGTMV